MRKIALLALMLVALAEIAGGGIVARAATLDSGENDLLAQVNSFRASRGLSTLVVSDSLTLAAKWMATDMSVNNYFAHTSLDGRSPTQRMADAGYPAFSTWTGENLAAGYTSTGDVLNGWINSPAHYAVLVNPHYRAIGVGRGYATGSAYGWYWTADFGGVVDAARAAPVSRAAAPAATVIAAAIALPPDSGYHASWQGQSADPTIDAGETATLV